MQSVQERLIAAQQPFELGPVAQRLIGAQRKQTFTDEMDRTALQTIGGLLGAATMPRRTVDTALQALGVDEKTRGAASAMFKSVQPGHEDIAALGQQFEDVAATIPTGTPTTTSELGSAVGSSAILAPLGLVGGPPLVGAASAAMESSQLLDEAKQAGASPLRQLVAAGAGAAIGSTEAMGSEEALGALGKTLMGAPRELRGRIVTAIASAMATGWAGEAGEEIFQGLGEDAVRQWAIQDPRAQRNLQQWIDRYGEIAVHQGLPAGLVGMFTSGLATATEQTLARSQGNRIRPGAQVSPGDSGPRAVSEVSPEVSPEVAPASPELANREATASAAGNLEIPSNDQPPVGPVDQGGAAAQPEAAMPPEAAQAAETGRATLERQNQRPVRLSANPNEEARAGRQFGRMMGFDVNLVESDDGAPLKYPGVTLGDNVTVDANSTLDMSVDQVVAHEAAHVLAGRSPSAFEAYLRKFTRLTPEQIARARAMYAERFGEGAPTGALADEEAVATLHEDFVGALRLAFTDEATLREGLRDRTVWEAVVDTMKRIANVLGGKFKLSIDQRIAALQERLLAEGDTGEVPAQIAAEMALEFKRSMRMVNEAKSALAAEDAKFQTAWHGSPHDFDRFSTENIGSGEGAQVYGHGLYFAGNKEVAEYYRNALGDSGDLVSRAYVDGKPIEEAMKSDRTGRQILSRIGGPEALYSALVYVDQQGSDLALAYDEASRAKGLAIRQGKKDLAGARRADLSVIGWLQKHKFEFKNVGRLYKVELAPQEDEYLLWDKPLSEQSEKVRAALKRLGRSDARRYQSGFSVGRLLSDPDGNTGQDLMTLLRDRGSPEAASKQLRALGIRGVKYLDQGGRGAGEGTYNYVIFDDKDVSITEKFAARPPSDETRAIRDEVVYRDVETTADESDSMRGAAWFDYDSGRFVTAHVTDRPDALIKFVQSGGDIVSGRGEDKYGDIGRGLYGSDAPQIWSGRAPSKWSFIERLTLNERSKIAEFIRNHANVTEPGYLSDSERKLVRDRASQFEREGTSWILPELASQPYNIRTWTPSVLERLGIQPGQQPSVVEMQFQGRFAHLRRYIDESEAEALRGLGYDGAFIPNGMASVGQMVFWSRDSILDVKRAPSPQFAARPSEESSARPEDAPTTGVKNAAVEEEMVRMGFDAPTHGPLLAFKTAWAEAKAKFDADPTVGAHLITQLDADPRPTSAREGAILALEMNRLIIARDAAINRHIVDPSPLNAEALFQAQAAYALAGEVVTRIGTETGQALAFRKMMVKRDYSLAAMERARRSANQGAELTDEQRAETKALYDKLADLERQLASAQAAGRSAAATTSIDETIAQVRKERKPRAVKGADVKLASLEDELAKMLEAEGIPVQPTAKFAARPEGGPELNPKILAKVTEVASAFRDLGYETFEDFSTHATARFGDAITPYLQSAWDETQKVVTKKADDARRFAANALVRKILAIGARWQTRYLGNKRQFFNRNAETLAVLAESGHLKDVSTIFDMYAGGGTYGLSYIEAGLTPDVKRIVLNEADPVRRHRLQLALEGKAADLLTLWTTDPTLAALKEKLAPTFVRSARPASRMIDEFKATDAYKNLSMDAKAAVLIVQDEMQGGYTKKWDHLVSTAFEDANRIQYLKRSAEARGVSVEVVGVNSWGEDAKKMVSEAGRSLVLLDPAYHGTSTGTYSVEGFTGDLGSTEALKLNVEGAKAMSDGNVVIYHNKATPEVGKQMRSAFGDKLFDNVWERSNGQPEFLGIFDGKGDGIDVDAMRKATPTVPVAEQTVTAQEGAAGTDIAAAEAAPEESTRPATTAERIETRLREGEPLVGLRYLVNKLARQFVEQGITDRDALVDAVHGVLSSIDPSIDRQTAADAISGYGAFRPYAGDEVARTLRDLKGQLLQLGKLASMEKGEAPKRTGSERPPASDEERRLIQRVNEEKKKGFADTATSLKSVLSSIATRFRNQIRDLDYQIQTRTRIVPTERPTPTSPEIEALRVERDRLQAIVDEIFAPQGPPAPDPITRRLQRQIDDLNQRLAEGNLEAKKVEHQGPQTENVMRLQAERERLQAELDDRRKAARPARSQEDIDAAKLRSLIKITERSITEIQAKLDSGNVGPDAQTPSTVTSPELEALRARRDAMREELNLARRALRPRVTPEQRAIQANRTRLANELARLRERIFYGEIERPTRQQKKSPRTLSDQELALQTEIRMERGKWAQILEQDRLAHRTRVERLKDAVKEVRDLPRALKASWDVSAVLRQGGFFALAHPVETATHLGPMLKALADPKYALAIDTALRSRDLAAFGDSSRLELTAIDGSLTKQEEGLRSRWSDRIPGIPASNRAFITLLNLVRASRFDAMVRAVPGTATIEQGRALANMVNVATGRGNPGKLGALVNAASYILWSPRLLLSRFQLIAGQPFYGGDASTRKIIAKEYARSLLGVAVVFSLAALAGSDPPEEDPRSTDFGKIKFGNTRIDPLAGLSQVTVLLSRLTSGEKKSLSDRVKAIRGDVEYGSDDSADILGRFFRTKLTPVLGTTVNVLSGKDVVGREVTPLTVATDLVVPLTFGDIYESMKEHGIAGGAALGVLSAFGMGVQTIEQHKPEAETSTAAHN